MNLRNDAWSPTRERTEQIRAAQVDLLYRHLPDVLVSIAAVVLVVVGVLWNVIAAATLIVWAILMFLAIAARWASWVAYRRALPAAQQIGRWERVHLLGVLFSGGLFGATGMWTFAPDAMVYQLFIIWIVGGVCLGSVISNSPYPPSVAAFVFPAMLPFVASFLLQGDQLHIGIAAGVAIFSLVLVVFGRNIHRTVRESLRLRYENLDLVAELTLKKEEAERANIAKSRFLAAASHDLRQPLHALSLLVSVLANKIRGVEAAEILAHVNDSLEALEVLFSALLDISKLDAGVVGVERTDFALQPLFERLQSEYVLEASEKQLRLRVVPSGMVLHSDRTLIERILRNLISNAIRYTETGGVVVGCRRRRENIRIEVRDSGPGISPGQQQEIFQEFFQACNPERDRQKGLGLGLAIVDRLTRLLGHNIDVKSVVGRGSVFALTVPRGHGTPVAPSAAGPTEAGIDLAGTCVLVLDDESAVLNSMSEILRSWGCQPLLADSTDSALAQLTESAPRPDAIFADYRLRGGQTGVQAIERIRAERGMHIPAAIITGDTAPDRLREAQASGYRLLHKPVRPASLRALLCDLVRK